MSVSKPKYTCDKCKKEIENPSGYTMVTVHVTATDYHYDDGSEEVDFYMHFHKSKKCWGNVLDNCKK